MSSSIPTTAVQGPPSDLKDFLNQTNNAGLNPPESSANSEDNWDVVDKDEALHEQDKAETAAEKQKQEAERKERMEKQKEERKAEKRKEKLRERMKGVSYAEAAGKAIRKS
ncbi:hypothetical protein J4E86_002597 [Alternaria arbusti]|uniref:uncharacterized protein n=1 Tax=Alternaria arbusti TaxID=232088 RepID=UPI00221FCD68|nr:uncharacterized protein J4E86_002597 [Alternaria arbusti]KAI4960970.1 hypothetical protein J4E86_002597 [Alternaria arbusti]